MVAGIADTHTALWHLFGDPRLSPRAKQFIESALERGQTIGLSSISLAEVVYLVEKDRIPLGAYEELIRVLLDPAEVFEEVPVDHLVTNSMRRVSRDEVPDLPDRIVAATALNLGVPVLSRDARIAASGLCDHS
jgi:PIN domain nuclease of toxin-antitoxin system